MITKTVAVLAILALLGSFLGHLHGVGDSLAVFRVAFALALLAAAWRFGTQWVRLPLIALAIAGLASVFWLKLPGDPAGPVVLYQKNMKFVNSDLEGLAGDIRAAAPDIVTMQEVSNTNELVLRLLQDVYPHQHLCRSSSSGTAILSRHPLVGDPVCGRGMGFGATQVQIGDQLIWVVSIHLSWPFPRAQPWQVEQLERAFARLEGSKLVAGDFNSVPWSYAISQVAKLSGSRRAGPSRPSFQLGVIPLPIDHVFAPGGGRVETRGLFGSDHRGLLARVHLTDAR